MTIGQGLVDFLNRKKSVGGCFNTRRCDERVIACLAEHLGKIWIERVVHAGMMCRENSVRVTDVLPRVGAESFDCDGLWLDQVGSGT